MTKDEVSSPTVSTEAALLSCVIDAHENRDLAIVDIPGAFLHVDNDQPLVMKMEGKVAELLVISAPFQSSSFSDEVVVRAEIRSEMLICMVASSESLEPSKSS